MLEPITSRDLFRLEALRLNRFNDRFAHILTPHCMVCLDEDNCLLIVCDRPSQVDAFIKIADKLKHYAWVVVGAKTVALQFAGEQVWGIKTLPM
jgi:hypothetical protein